MKYFSSRRAYVAQSDGDKESHQCQSAQQCSHPQDRIGYRVYAARCARASGTVRGRSLPMV